MSNKAKAKSTTGRKIKYLGSSHVRVLKAGENFSGRLAEPLENDVVWDLANNHIVDASEVGLSDEAITLLLGSEADVFDSGQYDEESGDPADENTIQVISEFSDVTDQSIIQPSLGQQIFLGLKPQEADEALRMSADGSGVTTVAAAMPVAAGSSTGTDTGGNVTTVGGSTGGAGGDTGGTATAT